MGSVAKGAISNIQKKGENLKEKCPRKRSIGRFYIIAYKIHMIVAVYRWQLDVDITKYSYDDKIYWNGIFIEML